MIKKILKLTVAVMTLGLFTTSVFAADWGISGQVRVNWDVSKTIQNDTDSTEMLVLLLAIAELLMVFL